MVVFDRGYCNYNWFAKLTANAVHFMTRLNSNAALISAALCIGMSNNSGSSNSSPLSRDAALVAAVYWQSWQIELLFRARKQNLKITTLVGSSANTLKIQIWTALIARLIVRYLQLRSRLQGHLSHFVALLRHHLPVYRDSWRFLDIPFEGPPPLRSDQLPPRHAPFTPADFGQQPVGIECPVPPNLNPHSAAFIPEPLCF